MVSAKHYTKCFYRFNVKCSGNVAVLQKNPLTNPVTPLKCRHEVSISTTALHVPRMYNIKVLLLETVALQYHIMESNSCIL